MIVTCPSCATSHDLPHQASLPDGTVIRCKSCGHGWLEARAEELGHRGDENLPAEHTDVEAEAELLVAKALKADKNGRKRRSYRRSEIRNWIGIAATLAVIATFARSFPEHIIRIAPGSGHIYQALGIKANAYGFSINKLAASQTVTTQGKEVLAVNGEIANISRSDRKAPDLVFTLSDKKGRKLHQWTLAGISAKAVPAGSPASFKTRISAPPKGTSKISVHFKL